MDIQNGSLLKKIDTKVGAPVQPKGLSSVTAVSTNDDHVAEFIYAGDLYGNLWKFDLTSNTPSDWKVAFEDANNTPRPLFKGFHGRPITTAPTVGHHPINGYMVYFGTGSYFAEGDHSYDRQATQTFYAIWDGAPEKSTTAGKVREADLLEQRIVAETTLNNVTFRKTTKYPIDWSTAHGWKMDLIVQTPASTSWVNNGAQPWPGVSGTSPSNYGERSVVQPLLSNGKVIIHTFLPGETQCSVGRHTWSLEVDANSGARLKKSAYAVHVDASGVRRNGIMHEPVMVPCNNNICTLSIDGSGNVVKTQNIEKTEKLGRRLWREIISVL